MIHIIDIGLSNINSVKTIYERIGYKTTVISSPVDYNKVSHLIFPGVGSFDSVVIKLIDLKLFQWIKHGIINKLFKYLGICVGMQILFENSDEGQLEGLGVLGGNLNKFIPNSSIKSVHMGWNFLSRTVNSPLLINLDTNSRFYFTHSYFLQYDTQPFSLACTNYSVEFNSIVGKDNFFGVQFHPEKSGVSGRKLLNNFAKI